METKILKAVFGGGTSTVTNKRTRTDYGQVLEIIGIDLPDTFECIFSNSATSAGVGKKQIGSAQRVLIPDEYLTTGQTIYAWILLHDTEDDGRHMYSIRIPVADMPDTSPEEPTPVEQSVISQAITALNSAVDTTTQKAQEATESADRAEQAAEGVEGYAERAESAQQAAESARDRAVEAETSARTSAATVSEKASEAISSATTASQSALTAENASESASASADASYQNAETAYRYAQDSATSAGQAGESEQTASQKATEASQKASEATQSASTAVQAKTDAETAKQASETAQGLAESARDGAVTAKTGAESARDEAQEIVDGITNKIEQIDSNTDRIESLEDDRYKPYVVDTASGAVASFPDGADGIPLKSCIVNIEPVQDLHGYDSPWPAGGGVNKFDPSLSVAYFDAYGLHFTNNGDGGIRFTGTATRDGGVMFRFWYLPIDFDATGKNVVGFGQPSGSLRFDVSGGRTTIVLTNLILENGKTYDFVVYVVVYEGDTAPTSWTPYSNECSITGWTGCEVQRTGVNVWDEEWEIGTINVSTGESAHAADRIRSKNLIPCLPSAPYYVIDPTSGSNVRLFFYADDGSFISAGYWTGNAVQKTPAKARFLRFIMAASYGTTYKNDISINYPSTDHDYHPYTGQTYHITFPTEAGTVYGEYADVVNGELVVDRAMVDLGSLNWTYFAKTTPPHFGTAVTNLKHQTNNILCSTYEVIKGNPYGNKDKTIRSTGEHNIHGIKVSDTAYTDAAAFKEAMNGVQLVYELAEPIHYPLSPNQIKSLYGHNNLWADTGDTEVEYRADVTLYINKKIAEAISALS